MPTYTYETLSKTGADPRRFEIFQRMSDDPLLFHPTNGQRIKRIITGGQGIRRGAIRRSTVVNKSLPAASACKCATQAIGHHRHNHTHNH